MGLSPEAWRIARNVNIEDACSYNGIPLVPWGNKMKLEGYGGLYIENCVYYNFSTKEWGNAIDFFVNYFNMAADEAALMLLDCVGHGHAAADLKLTFTKSVKKIEDGSNLVLPELSVNQHRAIAYLNKKRGIDAKLVVDLIKRKYVSQDKRGNVIFLWYDFDDDIRNDFTRVKGFELKGTGDSPFKHLSPNNKHGLGFNLRIGSEIERVYFFEATIDLLSFYLLNKGSKMLSDCLLVSMSTLGISIIFEVENYLINRYSGFKFDESNCIICTDNDSDKPKNYSLIYQENLRTKHHLNFTSLMPSSSGDWNDVLLKSL